MIYRVSAVYYVKNGGHMRFKQYITKLAAETIGNHHRSHMRVMHLNAQCLELTDYGFMKLAKADVPFDLQYRDYNYMIVKDQCETNKYTLPAMKELLLTLSPRLLWFSKIEENAIIDTKSGMKVAIIVDGEWRLILTKWMVPISALLAIADIAEKESKSVKGNENKDTRINWIKEKSIKIYCSNYIPKNAESN